MRAAEFWDGDDRQPLTEADLHRFATLRREVVHAKCTRAAWAGGAFVALLGILAANVPSLLGPLGL